MFIHVINVCPHNFKRDPSFCIASNHTLNIRNILVAISALMKSLKQKKRKKKEKRSAQRHSSQDIKRESSILSRDDSAHKY
jgi:hypothetical protein